MSRQIISIAVILFVSTAIVDAGPYTERGINGYIGDDWRGADPADEDAVINPIFCGWATGVASYSAAAGVDAQWANPNKALGPVTGDNFDIVSLGDLEQYQIDNGEPAGEITLSFSETIRETDGYDFVVFENGYPFAGMFAELGYVEVSSDGINFVRFPAVSLTPGLVGPYGMIDTSGVFNLAGKHPNAYGICTGTPFDLSDIANDPNVVSGTVDINNIKYVRIVDIPGSGDFYDEAAEHVDSTTWPDWSNYDSNHPVYDAWLTFGSGGLDLEAIGVLDEQEYSADINLDGAVDMFDFVLFASAWQSYFGGGDWIARCDLAKPKDYVIDSFDFAVFAGQWLEVEQWRKK